MTLDLSASAWRTRWQYCEDHRRKHFAEYAERVAGYVGPGYPSDVSENWAPINHTQMAISNWASQIAYANPRFQVGSSRENNDEESQKLELGLNRHVRQSDMRSLNEKLVVDYWLDFAVCLTTMEPIEGFSKADDPPYWPSDTRIAPATFIYDQQEPDHDHWRYMGHEITMDVDDAISEAKENPESGWNLDVLEQIRGGIPENTADREMSSTRDLREDRNEFTYAQIYCPEVTPDDLRDMGIDVPETDDRGLEITAGNGYRGALFYVLRETFGDDDVEFVREPTMWWGPRGGPYTFIPGYVVPSEPLPLSPNTATVAQAEAANTVARATLNSIERIKNVVLVAADDTDVQDAVNDAQDGEAVPVRGLGAEGLNGRVEALSLGGITAELLSAGQWTYDLLQLASGFEAAQGGKINADATATATAIAAQSSGAKLGFLSMKFTTQGVAEIGRKDAWYLFHDERAVRRVPKEEGGGFYIGGARKSVAMQRAAGLFPDFADQVSRAASQRYGKQVSFEDVVKLAEVDEQAQEQADAVEDPFEAMDFMVEPYSMQRTDEGVEAMRLQQTAGILSWYPQMLVQNPHVDEPTTSKMIGDFANLPGFENIINGQQLQAMRQMMLQGMVAPAEGGESRLGKDKQPPAVTSSPRPESFGDGKSGDAMPGRSEGNRVAHQNGSK